MTTLGALQAVVRDQLRAAGIESADTDARLLVQQAFALTREDLFLNRDRQAGEDGRGLLDGYVQRRLKREPVSRIAGVRAFWKSDFKICPETLDPRADSEVLMEKAVRLFHEAPSPSFLDLGTGSGCLLLSLLQEMPKSHGIGVDISENAIKTARENTINLNLQKQAEFIVSDWENLNFECKFDLVISNPPYITDHEMLQLDPEVADYDPPRALRGGEDGLDCYKSIISLLPRFLKEDGYVVFEIGRTQAVAVTDLLARGGFSVLETAQDLAGNDRCLVAQADRAKVKAL